LKWVVYGIVLGMPLLGLSYRLPAAWPGPGGVFAGDVAFYLAVLLGFTSVMIALVRHRLFDIDLLIRRPLFYSALTGLLALVYCGSIIILEGLLRGVIADDSPIVIVASTLLIAALSGRLRARVQAFIDRRFYRRKYDTARALAGFAASARDETDLGQLAGQLQQVVQETMQPASVTLWLRPAGRGKHAQ
jgi:hypothetical protein